MRESARPATSFVGRTRHLAQIDAHLDAGARIVTLTGPGGAGKTRLSLEVIAGRTDAYVVELAGVVDDEAVLSRVAHACGLSVEPEDPQELADALAGRQADILVLDNCEHLLRACAAVASAVARSPDGPRVLATSREALRIDTEITIAVEPLSHPDVREAPGLDALGAYEAVQLFVERARSAQPTFCLTGANAAAVAEICHRLDGIPLALELAAARIAVLAPEQIAERLDDRFRLLTSSARDVDARHQTMRAAIAWGFERLGPDELALMTRAALFQGRFDAEALEAACTDDLVTPHDVLDLIGTLAGRSLLVVEPDTRTSYRMLDTVRAFALEHLEDTDRWRARHRTWAAALSLEARDGLSGPNQAAWASRLAMLHDTLMAILTDAERVDPDAGLQIMRGLADHWDETGRTRETARRLERLLDACPAASASLRGTSLASLATALVHLGRRDDARARADEALLQAERSGDRSTQAVCLNAVGNVRLRVGDRAVARDAFRRAVEIRRDLGAPQHLAATLGNLAVLEHEMGDVGSALALYDEAAALFAEIGDRRRRAITLMNRATLIDEQGDPAAALTEYDACLQIVIEMGMRRYETMLHVNIGNAHRALGGTVPACQAYLAGIAVGLEIDFPAAVRTAVEGIAAIAAASGDHAAWARLDSGLDAARAHGALLAVGALTEEARRVATAIVAGTAPVTVEAGRGTFRRTGDLWEVAFGGPPIHLRHAKGMAYIARLLATPETEVHVADLVASAGTADEGGIRRQLGDAGDAIDRDAARAYAETIRALEAERDEAVSWSDPARAARLTDEIERIGSHLKASYGLAGRGRAQADPTERMRKAVTNRIKDAIARIESEDLELGRYLRNTLQTGVFCRYHPARPVAWDL